MGDTARPANRGMVSCSPMTATSRTLTVRPMVASDVEPLAAALGWPDGGIRARWDDAERGRREMFVAEFDGRVAGSVSIKVHDHLPRHLHLFALEVAPAVQRRGIGTALIAAVEDESRRRGMCGVWLDVGVENSEARRLYERLGYVADGALVTVRYSVPNEDGTWRDIEEACHRMYRAFGEAF